LLKTNAFPLQTAPGILFLAFFPGRRAWNRQHEKEKEKRADGVDNVNAGKTNMRDDEPVIAGPDRADLKDAVVPGDRVTKSITRASVGKNELRAAQAKVRAVPKTKSKR